MDLLILSTPLDFFGSQVLPFLSLKDLAHLDAATVNENLRRKFFARVAYRFLCSNIEVRLKAPAVKWLVKRRIGLVNMRFWPVLSDEAIMSLSPVLRFVRHVSFRGCMVASDAAVKVVREQCPLLESADFCSFRNVSVGAIADLLDHCPHIHTLNISQLNLRDSDIISLLDRLNAGRLKHLSIDDVSYLPALTDASIIAVAGRCPLLETLSIGDNIHVTNRAIDTLIEQCRHLKLLNVAGCRLLTEECIVGVIERCRSLESLNVSKNNQMATALVLAAAEHGKSLKRLDIRDCDQITKYVIRELRVMLPNLTVVTYL